MLLFDAVLMQHLTGTCLVVIKVFKFDLGQWWSVVRLIGLVVSVNHSHPLVGRGWVDAAALIKHPFNSRTRLYSFGKGGGASDAASQVITGSYLASWRFLTVRK